jgi:hypothetical protein
MTDLQRLVVDDHIRRLSDEGAARRSQRELARRRHPSAETISPAFDLDVEGHSFAAPPAAAPRPATDSARIRVGRWLMGIGTAIAGSDQAVGDAVRRATAEAAKPPCTEDPKHLSHAA